MLTADLELLPNPAKALAVLEKAAIGWQSSEVAKVDLAVAISQAVGHLRGYRLPPEVLQRYHCSFCEAAGVKLWRAIHSAEQGWCSKCGTAQAGLPDNVDDEGRIPSECSGSMDGKSDQIYSSRQGQNLLPWVPAPDGETWGYTSVPLEGCEWWRALPTRKERSC